MEILAPVLSLFAQWSHVLMLVACVAILASLFVTSRALEWIIVVIAVPAALLSLLAGSKLVALVWGFNALMSIRRLRGRPFTL